MTKGEFLKDNITTEDIANGIYNAYCDNGLCEKCPVYEECELISDKLTYKSIYELNPMDIIRYWLNDCMS